MASSFSYHFLWVVILLAAITHPIAGARPPAGKTSTQFIKTSCGATTYPNLCYTSLSVHAAAIRSDPELLAHTALSVTIDTARSTSAMMAKLSLTQGLKPREAAAVKDCMEEIGDSVDELRKSLGEMQRLRGSKDFALKMSNVETWVSAALTDDDTCTDGFAGKAMDGRLKTAVRERIVNVAHLTSNALALINSFAALHS